MKTWRSILGERRLARVQPARVQPDHDEYLKSPVWQAKRKRALNLANYRCQLCDAPGRREKANELHVHHCTYDRRGKERDEYLVVLCRSCHSQAHGRNGVTGAPVKYDPEAQSDETRAQEKFDRQLNTLHATRVNLATASRVVAGGRIARATYDSTVARVREAALILRHGGAKRALPVFHKAVEELPEGLARTHALCGLAYCAEKTSVWAEAESLYKQIIKRSRRPYPEDCDRSIPLAGYRAVWIDFFLEGTGQRISEGGRDRVASTPPLGRWAERRLEKMREIDLDHPEPTV